MAGPLNELPEVKSVSDGNGLFSSNLHGILRTQNPGNLIYSPFSISAVVAMAKLGAAGSTKEEIERVLGMPADHEVLKNGYAKVMASLKEENDGYTLAAANRMYAQIGFALNEDYKNAVQTAFGAEIEQLDFGNNVESAAKINEWVEKITQEKIQNLIPSDALNALTRIVLVNGVYFKGFWKTKFNPEHTQTSPFHLNDSETVDVDLMFKKFKFPYAEFDDLDAKAVELPYKGDRLSMLIYLPRDGTCLKKLEEGLAGKLPTELLTQFGPSGDVEVYLPRFKIEAQLGLVEAFKKLGITDMFDESKANFSGIPAGDESLHVSEVVQKAFIEVNEEGTEAAAATGLIMMTRCMPMSIEFRADRPFVFQIVDRHTNFILFAGTCLNPKA